MRATIANRLLVTHNVGLPPSITALHKDYSITSSASKNMPSGTVTLSVPAA